jgi:hypothetical protein
VHRSLVDPLRIIDEPEDRPPIGRRRYQIQGSDTNEETIRRGTLGETKHLIQSVPARHREFGVVPGKWPAKLLEAGVRELHLGLDTPRTADAEVISVLRKIAEQSRLPNSGFSPEHENARLALPSPVKLGSEPPLLLAPPEQFVAGGIGPDGIPARERGIRSITATH